jgi:hypothetical protein
MNSWLIISGADRNLRSRQAEGAYDCRSRTENRFTKAVVLMPLCQFVLLIVVKMSSDVAEIKARLGS